MRGLALPVAAGALVALLAVAAVQLLGPIAPLSHAEQAAAIAAELRCPDCQGLSVAESRTAAADAIRSEIDAQLAAGRSADEVRQHFVDRYGEWILLTPDEPLPWVLPGAALVGGLAGLAAWLLRGRTRPAPAPAPVPAGEAERRRIRDEVESLDA
jgi:cytochrome c-type biogenesis protein CcmH/NrfF